MFKGINNFKGIIYECYNKLNIIVNKKVITLLEI